MNRSSLNKVTREHRGLSTLEYVVLFVIIVVGSLTFWSKVQSKLIDDVDAATDATHRPASAR